MGFITDAIGLTNFDAQDEANKTAKESLALQKETNQDIKKLSDEQIKLNIEEYQKWSDIFGPTFDDLGTYFKNLTGDIWTAKKAVEIQKQTQLANNQLNQAMAARGVQDSGLSMSLMNNNLMQGAIAKANVASSADEYVAQQKLGFAGLGLQQQQLLLGSINNTYNSTKSALGGISAGYSNMTSTQTQAGLNYAQQNSGMMDNILGAITYTIG